ncbi:MAG TPA: hypothetical protein VMR06_01930 [Dokdonella sp.]|uniref:hypothetical protein n=1 Tax=Dokdonella sp. TaxID=2291710 RepID=UPI002BE310E6|nr:hypothetical protein [Dokdonella sp.]HUD40734.1 hypothetical protein [Dokdonella sp.]
MSRIVSRIVFAILAGLAAATAGGAGAAEVTGSSLVWPPLPSSGFVAGRPATQDDVDAGNALFLLGDGTRSSGEPMAIDIPQYALFDDEGIITVVVVVQAESEAGRSQIGARKPDGTPLIGLLDEFKLVGTQPQSTRATN